MAQIAEVPRARSVESLPGSKKIDPQSQWKPHGTKMAQVAEVPRARSVENLPRLKKHQKSIPRANGSHMALKWPRSLKYRARAALRASPGLKTSKIDPQS
jgi:hypothetical protein